MPSLYFSINGIQSQNDIDLQGDWLVLSVSVENPRGCRTAYCKKLLITKAQKNIATLFKKMNKKMTFTNGQTYNVQLIFCSFNQLVAGKIFNHLSNTSAILLDFVEQ